MDIKQAKNLLKLHAYAHEEIYNPKMQNGFLGSLRPFTGLNEDNFHEVMYSLKVIQALFDKNECKIDREIISSIWGICYLARAWGIDTDGILRRNNLITNEDIIKLESWINHISCAFWGLLDGLSEEAFEDYLCKYGDFKRCKNDC
jgi:hypothetical protein